MSCFEDRLVRPPKGTMWWGIDYLAEVARVVTMELDQQTKKTTEPRKRLIVRFKISGIKNYHQEQEPVLSVPKKDPAFDPLIFVPRKLRSRLNGKREPTIKKTDRDTSKNLRIKLKRPLEPMSDAEERTKPKKQKKNRNPVRSCNSLPVRNELPMNFKNAIMEMNGSEEKLVIQKKLFETDVSETHGRLSIPLGHMIDKDFLTSDEEKVIKSYSKGKPDLSAVLIDPLFRRWSLKLRRWVMSSSYQYALVSGWNDVVEANGLKGGDNIQLWAFRSQSTLCFALVLI